MNRKLTLLTFLFFFSFLLPAQNLIHKDVSSSPRKVVTIGYVVDGVNQENPEAAFKKSGYSYEYLQKLVSYTGWRCNYVYGNWGELYDKLISGKIDLMPSVIRTDEREQFFNFPHFSMGHETFVIYTNTNRLGSNPRDISILNGFKIGVIDNTVHTQVLQDWADNQQIDISIVHFDDEAVRYESFVQKEIDGFVDLDILSAPDIYPVVTLDTKDTYFAFSKDKKDLCEELNEAMSSLLYINPYYNSSLWTKYYSNVFAQKELLEEEKKWLDENNNISVGILDDDFPYCYKDKNGNAAGYIVDLLNFSRENYNVTNINYNYVIYSNYQKLMEDLQNNKIQLAFPVYMSLEQAEHQNYILSDTVYQVDMSYICNNTTNEMADNVAVSFSRLTPSYMADFFPDTKLTLFDSRKNCLEAVLDRQCNGAIFNSIQIDNFVHKSRKYRGLKIVSLPHTCDIGFAVTRKNLTLLSLVNRGICTISSEQKAESITYHTLQNNTYTIKDFISDYIELFVFILIFIFLLLLMLVISLDKLRAYLNYDSLTRLLNRRSLNTYLELAKHRAEEKNEPFTLLMLDIDDFKRVNDVYGHVCGDEVLKAVAKTLMHSVSNNDYIFRWGGEEILVLVNADKDVSLKVAERIRRSIQNLCVDFKSNQIKVTVTIGVAPYESGSSIKSLFEAADAKMYEGKKNGKNIVVS